MSKKPQPDLWYKQLVAQHTPKKKLLRNSMVAFFSGGLLCGLAEVARVLMTELSTLSEQQVSSRIVVVVVGLAALATGLGFYDRAGQKLGAGLAVPITGFANSAAAAMLEHKYEGMVLGSGCNSFKLAGAVVVFGITSAFVVTTIALIFGAV